jgi:hypothetical protein
MLFLPSVVLAEATLSDGTSVELRLVIALVVAVAGWVGQAVHGRSRITSLEDGLKTLSTTVTGLTASIAGMRIDQQKDREECREQFHDLQRQVDRCTPQSAASLSGVRQRMDG